MIFWDLDGVIRSLQQATWGHDAPTWDYVLNGMGLVESINQDMKLLLSAPPTKYYPIIAQLNNAVILTHQQDGWKRLTSIWIGNHFPETTRVIFVRKPEDKLSYLTFEDDILVDDYPYFKSYDKVALVDYPYNRNVNCKIRIRTIGDMERIIAQYG